jgi:hypothetical protein
MLVIAVFAYLGLTLLFVLGLALAASRPAPPVDNIIEWPADVEDESRFSLGEVA